MRYKQWEAFCGYSSNDSAKILEKSLQYLNVKYQSRYKKGNKVQNFFLGAKKDSEVFLIEGENSFEIKVIPVTGDPLYRVTMSLLGTSETIKSNKQVSLINMSPSNNESKKLFKKIMTEFYSNSSKYPWEIDHPRFKISLGLNIRNRRKWLALVK